MDDKKLIGGALLSPTDERDYRVKASIGESDYPTEYEIPYTPPTEVNQGRVGNCVGQAVSYWYTVFQFIKSFYEHCQNSKIAVPESDAEMREFAKTYKENRYSVAAIYGNRRYDSNCKGVGMNVRSALDAAIHCGDCPSDIWDSNAEAPSVVDMFEMYYDSFKAHLIPALEYIHISSKKEAMYMMSKHRLPLIVVLKASKFDSLASGYHCVAAYAYRDYGDGIFTIDNSWGGKYDHKEFTFDDFEECWALIPTDYIEFSDVDSSHWANSDIQNAVSDGLMFGYPDGTFKPDEPITRAEVAAVAERIYRGLKT